MPKGDKNKSRRKKNGVRRREFLKKNNLPPGWKWKKTMQSLKQAAQEWKGAIGSNKRRTVFQLMLTKGPMYSYDESDWGKRIASVLVISQEDANEMVRKAKQEKVVLMKSEDKTTLEKAQKQITSGVYEGVPSHALEILEI